MTRKGPKGLPPKGSRRSRMEKTMMGIGAGIPAATPTKEMLEGQDTSPTEYRGFIRINRGDRIKLSTASENNQPASIIMVHADELDGAELRKAIKNGESAVVITDSSPSKQIANCNSTDSSLSYDDSVDVYLLSIEGEVFKFTKLDNKALHLIMMELKGLEERGTALGQNSVLVANTALEIENAALKTANIALGKNAALRLGRLSLVFRTRLIGAILLALTLGGATGMYLSQELSGKSGKPDAAKIANPEKTESPSK